MKNPYFGNTHELEETNCISSFADNKRMNGKDFRDNNEIIILRYMIYFFILQIIKTPDKMNTIAPFLTKERLSKKIDHINNDYEYGLNIFVLNIPLLYTIVYGTFDTNIFLFSYLFTGLFQGCITSLFYKICDSLYSTKTTNFNEWKTTKFYDNVVLNFDSAYLYAVGSSVYGALTFVPSCIRWEIKSINYMTHVFNYVC
jgi:hypothetical protein